MAALVAFCSGGGRDGDSGLSQQQVNERFTALMDTVARLRSEATILWDGHAVVDRFDEWHDYATSLDQRWIVETITAELDRLRGSLVAGDSLVDLAGETFLADLVPSELALDDEQASWFDMTVRHDLLELADAWLDDDDDATSSSSANMRGATTSSPP